MTTTVNTTMQKPLSECTPAEIKARMKELEAVQERNRAAYKALVTETVPNAARTLIEASEALITAKGVVFDYFRDVMKMKAEVFEVKEDQRSHTFTDENYSITIGYRQTDGWDDTASAGIQKVKNYIQSLATDENSGKLVQTVYRLLSKDTKGNLKANRVMELQKMTAEFDNDDFADGVKIIVNSYKPVRSCWFIEATINGKDGSKTSIPLSMSAVGFPEGFEFDFFAETIKATP